MFQRTRIALLNRLDTYASTLRNVVALFQTGGIPNRKQIHEYLGRLAIQDGTARGRGPDQ